MINTQLAVRHARQSDHAQIANLMYFEPHVHRHLDWRGPLEWLDAPQYWVLEQNGVITAALACPPDPEGVSWLRLFAHSSDVPITEAWNTLWDNAKTYLAGSGLLVAAITVADWFSPLLSESGFDARQEIVVLEQISADFQRRPNPSGVVLRPMTESDLTAVTAVDKSGFARLWRNSRQALDAGFKQAGFAAVASVNDEIVGYQISTRNSFGVHLARLAVSAQFQGEGIGYLLVQDLISQSWQAGLHRLTVNTQSDNSTSLALYQKMGFKLTGERYSVYTNQL
ncbi:MAG TPA: GNAT family N-acetyltransferase [Anaerolineales bacterium]|jgi:ribosomal-protein-alanine N-acetyltransferase